LQNHLARARSRLDSATRDDLSSTQWDGIRQPCQSGSRPVLNRSWWNVTTEVNASEPIGSLPPGSGTWSGGLGTASDIEVSTSALVPGKNLRFPIYDKTGLLLVARGAVITPRFKELLVLRRMQKFVVSRTDDQSGSAHVSGPAIRAEAMDINSDAIRKLDGLIESGQFGLEHAGEEFKSRLQVHDCEAFDEDLRNELVNQHAETCSILDQMICAAAQGDTLDAEDIATVVSTYLSRLAQDSDCLHCVMAYCLKFASLAQHCLQSALLAMALAIELRMDESTVRRIGMCGLLHDWGMTYVPEHIRQSNRVLTRIEFLEIMKHPIHTANILERLKGLPPQVQMICYQVHESPNGSGYPRRRQGSTIHPCAGILKVADAYIALTSPRPFRLPLSPSAAIQCLVHQAGQKTIDSLPARALLNVLSQFPIGSLVRLNDGSKAQVLRRNGDNYQMPIVQILETPDGTQADPRDQSRIIDPSKSGTRIIGVLPSPGRQELDLDPDVLVLKRS
jgi:HD-GYP domain-containing protein (c-di-GMP phosphodiesterase class II)